MTLQDVNVIFKAWERSPPTHHLVAFIAGALGWRRAENEDPADPETSFPPQFIISHGNVTSMPPVTFDVEELRLRNEEAMKRIAERNAGRG